MPGKCPTFQWCYWEEIVIITLNAKCSFPKKHFFTWCIIMETATVVEPGALTWTPLLISLWSIAQRTFTNKIFYPPAPSLFSHHTILCLLVVAQWKPLIHLSRINVPFSSTTPCLAHSNMGIINKDRNNKQAEKRGEANYNKKRRSCSFLEFRQRVMCHSEHQQA